MPPPDRDSNSLRQSVEELLDDWRPPDASSSEMPALPASGAQSAPSRSPLDEFIITGVHPTGSLAGDRAPNPWETTRPRPFSAASNATVPAAPRCDYPRAGSTLSGFRLISVIGSGAFARVYLAEQQELAGRLVALKVTQADSDEPQALARLQHSHIVPIHSVHDDPGTGLRLLCMPYLGGANLEQILSHARGSQTVIASGRSLAEALERLDRRASDNALRSGHLSAAGFSLCRDHRGGALPGGGRTAASGERPPTDHQHPLRRSWFPHLLKRSARSNPSATPASGAFVHAAHSPPRSAIGSRPQLTHESPNPDTLVRGFLEPARAFYCAHSFARSAVWIVARLAEGLAHAHSRGILHRDLKPSNVLITADGTPMLLDFNLSVRAAADSEAEAGRQRVGGTLPYMAPEHLSAFLNGSENAASSVKEQSDIYSLGLILYEMIAGRLPFPTPDSTAPIASVIETMIADRKKGARPIREVDARVAPSLESILRVCLQPDPQRRYRSASALAEDLRRFLEDRRLAHAPDTSPVEHFQRWLRRHPGARGASGVGLIAVGLLGLAGVAGWAVTDRLATASASLLRSQFEAEFRDCQVRLNTTQGPKISLEEAQERARVALAAYDLDGRKLPAHWFDRSGLTRLSIEDQRSLREELAELLLMRSRTQRHTTTDPHKLEEAADWLEMAQMVDIAPRKAVFLEIAACARARGELPAARAAERRASETPASNSRDEYLLGALLAAEGRIDAAERHLSRSVTQDPRRFWAWFSLGICHFDQGRFDDAAADFAACSLLEPRFAWPHYNRGQALARAGRLEEARIVDNRAVELDPALIEARVNRALVCLELGRNEQALADLTYAQKHGPGNLPITAAYAEALNRNGRHHEAQKLLTQAIDQATEDPALRTARGFHWLGRGDLEQARTDLEAAIALDPRSARAWLGLAHVSAPGDIDRALGALDSALDLDPGLGDARQLRAVLRARQGDLEAASDIRVLAASSLPRDLYNAACAETLLARAAATPEDRRLGLDRARKLLQRAIDAQYPLARAKADPDLAEHFAVEH